MPYLRWLFASINSMKTERKTRSSQKWSITWKKYSFLFKIYFFHWNHQLTNRTPIRVSCTAVVCRRYFFIPQRHEILHWNISNFSSEQVVVPRGFLLVEIFPKDDDPPNCHPFTPFSHVSSFVSLFFAIETRKKTESTLLLIHWRILTSLSVSHSGDSLTSYWWDYSSEQFARENLVGVISTMINFTRAWSVRKKSRLGRSCALYLVWIETFRWNIFGDDFARYFENSELVYSFSK